MGRRRTRSPWWYVAGVVCVPGRLSPKRAGAFGADVAEVAGAEGIIDAAIKNFGRFEILVNQLWYVRVYAAGIDH